MERIINENVTEHKYIYSIASGKIKFDDHVQFLTPPKLVLS